MGWADVATKRDLDALEHADPAVLASEDMWRYGTSGDAPGFFSLA